MFAPKRLALRLKVFAHLFCVLKLLPAVASMTKRSTSGGIFGGNAFTAHPLRFRPWASGRNRLWLRKNLEDCGRPSGSADLLMLRVYDFAFFVFETQL